ncbi:unnamed protein product [Macrosiphum euphorbiae]|uniref:Bromo domain-containing protein n=1 Tax=Macrosiphum euphorbiae TaxID=13131 RepID=A0AAV0WKJ4_9HEMI|nr:unnamed protein product [Macrosiphum euphorbiae]
MSNVNPEEKSMEYISISSSELSQIRDFELKSVEKSHKSRIKSKRFKRIEDLRRKRQVRRGHIGLHRQSIELKSKKAEEAEKQRAVEVEIQRSKEAKKQRVVEVEIQRSKEADEIISRKVKKAEIKKVKDVELERFKNDKIKKAKEVETKKHKEAELRKNIAVEETQIKSLDKRSTLKKVNEPGNNRSFGQPEVNLVKNNVVRPVHFKRINEHVENDINMITNDDFETFNIREQGIRKCMGSEGKTSKEIETNSTKVKMITRTRGLKVEEKLKESYVSKNVPTKRPQIKSSGSSSSSASPTSIENPSIPSYEYKKQTINTDDNSKRNITSNKLHDKKNKRDLNIDPSVIIRKENLNREVIGIPRTRTRSSSFKQKIKSETTSSKQDQDNDTEIIPKETVGTKTIVSTSTYPDHQTTKSKSPPKTIFDKHTLNDNNCGKTLLIPVVMLSTNQIPLHKVHQRSVNNFIKQQEIKPTHDQIQKQTVTTTQLDKPLPKKRGRKRRIDLPTEKQESNSRNRTSQNAAKCNTSIKEVEPPAKRTRRSLGLRGRKKEAMNNYAQPRSTTVEPRQSKKQCVEKSNENNETCKRLMKFVFNNLCEKSKYISTLNKEVTDTPYADVIKCPIEARGIKRKIATGEIGNLAELQVNLLLLAFNAQMINRTDSIVFNDATHFQTDLHDNCLELKDAVGKHYASNEDGTVIKPDNSIKVEFPEYSSKIVNINNETIDDILLKYTDLTSDESTDSDDSDTPPPKKKRKKNLSDSSNSESD